MAAALMLAKDQVNIKATTEEGLGFTGTGQGISAQAICSLTTPANMAGSDPMAQRSCEGCGGCARRSEKDADQIS